MNARTFAVAASAVVLAASLAAADPGNGLAKGHEKKRERPAPVELDWKRDAKARPGRVGATAPAPPELPDDLRVAAPSGGPRVAVPAGEAVDTVPDRARRVAVEIAEEAVRVWGFREYWRAGFARGFDEGMHDPRVPAAEREDGFRHGRLDPRALLTGQQLAQNDAADQAERAAEDRVRQQFTDLSRQPQRDRDPAVRPGAPAWAGALFAVAPVLDAVFVSMPLHSAAGISREGRAAADGWRVEPAVLARL